MKKCLMAFFAVALAMQACRDGKQTAGGLAEAAAADEPTETEADSVDEVMPVGADELFDDFFFNYASSLHQQQERTVFPLTVTDGDKVRQVQRRQWKLEPFFMKQDAYTLIFDSPAQMNLLSDTTVADVTVERLYLDKDRVAQFLFSRKSGRWMLHEIRWQPLARNPNAQFLKFYRQFVTDSVFQHQSLAEQIMFSGPDPDDDFSTIEGMITPDFWDAFQPELPQHTLYNIVYGHQDPAASQKILLLRGIANGLEVELTFRLQKGRWKVVRLIT